MKRLNTGHLTESQVSRSQHDLKKSYLHPQQHMFKFMVTFSLEAVKFLTLKGV